MPVLYRIVEEMVGHLEGKSKQDVVNSLPFIQLTPCEMWDRLLRKNKLVQRTFPKQAFLRALDDLN